MISEVKKEDQSKYKDAEEYINGNIAANKFSYHQINIFIKLFIKQYKTDKAKLILKMLKEKS